MQFQKPFKQAIADGWVTLSFRHWRAPQAKVGGRYQIRPYGAIEVDAVGIVDADDISNEDAIQSGFDGRAEILRALSARQGPDTRLYRVAFRFIGELADPRVELRETRLDDAQFDALATKLRRMDGSGLWTKAVLERIGEQPGTRAGDLAPAFGWDTPRFKTQVRKLKAQGLTESLEVGYRLSPRGRDYLDRLGSGAG